jgi:hypothetical protein
MTMLEASSAKLDRMSAGIAITAGAAAIALQKFRLWIIASSRE